MALGFRSGKSFENRQSNDEFLTSERACKHKFNGTFFDVLTFVSNDFQKPVNPKFNFG